jgi:hypothetical protein
MNNESRVLLGLMARGLPPHIAQGVTANMIAESRLDPGINEIAPLVPGSRGGFGLNQWTGPRRKALEEAARQRGVPVNDLDFQLDFTMEELRGPEAKAWNALQGASSAEEAARLYSERFLRPGIPHMDARLSNARRLAGQPTPEGAPTDWSQAFAQQPPQQQQQQQQQNALAPEPQEPEGPRVAQNPLDPRAFMSQPFNALAQPDFTPRYLQRRA